MCALPTVAQSGNFPPYNGVCRRQVPSFVYLVFRNVNCIRFLLIHSTYSCDTLSPLFVKGGKWWREHWKLPFLPEALHDPVAQGSGLQRHHGGPQEVKPSYPAILCSTFLFSLTLLPWRLLAAIPETVLLEPANPHTSGFCLCWTNNWELQRDQKLW